ncbi:MAG: prepilin-type N-terminal cleavage/methylation domain-containing protein [Deltaproteobacteria bacterium]|nr:prepilin-type N-terminal cleavage/methylation domain-containing protein [Deltaproteobacteria bacterium]
MSFKFQVSSFKFQVQDLKSKVQSPKTGNAGYWLLTTGYCSRGFTLLEVLVASAILSLVLAALYGVFSRTLASKRLAEERAARARAARIVLLRLGEDLRATVPPTTSGVRFIGETRRSGAFREDSLSFASVAHSLLTNASLEGDLCEIGYTLLPDPVVPTQRQLVRRVTLDLAADRNLAADAYPLLERVRGLRFRFFDGRNWRDEWGRDETQNKLPSAVEVGLSLEDAREDVTEFSTVIDLPLAATQRLVTP